MQDISDRKTKLFQALADPSRRSIFELLLEGQGETAVKELTQQFDISQPAVSQHLATLKAAGLVTSRRDGRIVYYCVEPTGLKPLIDWLAHYRGFWIERVQRLDQLLEELDESID